MKFSDYLIKLALALQPSEDQFDVGDLVVVKDEFTSMGEHQELYAVSSVNSAPQVPDGWPHGRPVYDQPVNDQIEIITVNQQGLGFHSSNDPVAVNIRHMRVSRKMIRHPTLEEVEKLNELHVEDVRKRFLKGVQRLYGQIPTAGALKDAGRFDTVTGLTVQVESAFEREKVLAVDDSTAPEPAAEGSARAMTLFSNTMADIKNSINYFDELQFRKRARKLAKEAIKAFRKGTLDQVTVDAIPPRVEFDDDGHSFATLVLLRNDLTGWRMEYLLGSFVDRKEFRVLINPGEWTTMVTVTVCVHEKFSTRLYVNP